MMYAFLFLMAALLIGGIVSSMQEASEKRYAEASKTAREATVIINTLSAERNKAQSDLTIHQRALELVNEDKEAYKTQTHAYYREEYAPALEEAGRRGYERGLHDQAQRERMKRLGR